MLYQLMDRLRRFMAGRYGMDNLGLCLLGAYFIVGVFVRLGLAFFRARLPYAWWMDAAGLVPLLILGWAVWRMLSKNIPARCAENGRITESWNRLRHFFSRTKGSVSRIKLKKEERKTHRVFSCPSCGQQVRVPRGKGKIAIICPKCRVEFIKKT